MIRNVVPARRRIEADLLGTRLLTFTEHTQPDATYVA